MSEVIDRRTYKEMSPKEVEALICYCFKKSKEELYEKVKEGKEQEFIDDIKAKMKDPGCFCEKASPTGKCCLSEVESYIKEVKKTLRI